MFKKKDKYSVLSRAISVFLIHAFLVSGVAFAIPEANRFTLATPSTVKSSHKVVWIEDEQHENGGHYDIITHPQNAQEWKDEMHAIEAGEIEIFEKALEEIERKKGSPATKEEVRDVIDKSLGGRIPGAAFRKKWAFSEVSMPIADMLGIIQKRREGGKPEFNDATSILIPLLKKHMQNLDGMRQVLLEGYELDQIKEIRNDANEIIGFTLPVTRDAKPAHEMQYYLAKYIDKEDSDMPIGKGVYMRVESIAAADTKEALAEEKIDYRSLTYIFPFMNDVLNVWSDLTYCATGQIELPQGHPAQRRLKEISDSLKRIHEQFETTNAPELLKKYSSDEVRRYYLDFASFVKKSVTELKRLLPQVSPFISDIAFVKDRLQECEDFADGIEILLDKSLKKVDINTNLTKIIRLTLRGLYERIFRYDPIKYDVKMDLTHNSSFLFTAQDQISHLFLNLLLPFQACVRGKIDLNISTQNQKKDDKNYILIRINSSKSVSLKNMVKKDLGIEIGFPLAQKLTRQLNGTIEVESHSTALGAGEPGKSLPAEAERESNSAKGGTTFTIRLPVAEQASAIPVMGDDYRRSLIGESIAAHPELKYYESDSLPVSTIWERVPKTGSVADLPSIWGKTGQNIKDELAIDNMVDPPLVDACKILFRKGIRTIYTSANETNVKSGAKIEIDAQFLSPENTRIAKTMMTGYRKEGYVERTYRIEKEVYVLCIPFTMKTTNWQLSRKACNIVNLFQPQSSPNEQADIRITPESEQAHAATPFGRSRQAQDAAIQLPVAEGTGISLPLTPEYIRTMPLEKEVLGPKLTSLYAEFLSDTMIQEIGESRISRVRIPDGLKLDKSYVYKSGAMEITCFKVDKWFSLEGRSDYLTPLKGDHVFMISSGNKNIGHGGLCFFKKTTDEMHFRFAIHKGERVTRILGRPLSETFRGKGYGKKALALIMAICSKGDLLGLSTKRFVSHLTESEIADSEGAEILDLLFQKAGFSVENKFDEINGKDFRRYTYSMEQNEKNEPDSVPEPVTPETEQIHATALADTIEYIQAQDDGQPIAGVVLGSSWIEGYNEWLGKKGEDPHFQFQHINRLISSIRGWCEERKIPFKAEDDRDKDSFFGIIEGLHSANPDGKVVVLASNNTVTHDKFKSLRNNKKSYFLAGVNNEKLDETCYIRLVEMLNITLRLAFDIPVDLNNPHITIVPITAPKSKEALYYIFTPGTEPMNYDKLRRIYRLQAFA